MDLPQTNKNAIRCKAYRARRRAEGLPYDKTWIDRAKRSKAKNVTTNAEYCRAYRQRKRQLGNDVTNNCLIRNMEVCENATEIFNKNFLQNDFGCVCDVCDRLWFQSDLKLVLESFWDVLRRDFPTKSVKDFRVCVSCYASLKSSKIPTLSKSNGFEYPTIPPELPELNLIEERLVSPRIPFMQIRRLRYAAGSYGIIGQVVNVPIDVQKTINLLPRNWEDDMTINVHIKRQIFHKTSYLKGFVNMRHVMQWLMLLVETPLYRANEITFDYELNALQSNCGDEDLESVETNDAGTEYLVAQQQTLLWDEERKLDFGSDKRNYAIIAPGQTETPLALLYDDGGWELSFPQIFFGHRQRFKDDMRVTIFQKCTSIIRRADRRGVNPTHCLYMASAVMRARVRDSLRPTFQNTDEMTKVTKKMIQDKDFLERCGEDNLLFLKSIPNSMQYWSSRKKDLFAMMRQLGKPTVFLTISSAEVHWPRLLNSLYKLKHGRDYDGDICDASSFEKSVLVNEDPVMCVVYFNKMIEVIMNILKNEKGPLGRHYVVDSFLRIEFQHRGSAHAHVLLWLNDAPCEELSENMSATINLIDKLSSVSRVFEAADIRQSHKHTHTCYKNNKNKCRFGAPFWPVYTTLILIPMDKDDTRKKQFTTRYKNLHKKLEDIQYESLEEFLSLNRLSYDGYLNVLRAGIKRPTVFYRRNMNEKWINPFNPWIAKTIGSNTDFQYILDEYSCAAYVVEYVNKTNRGLSDLHRHLIKLSEEKPDMDYTEMLRTLGTRVLNAVEMCLQEAAWYLLRIPMCETSRKVEFVPTVWPHERAKCHKTREEMSDEQEDSTDIWRDDIIKKYECRPVELEHETLARFVAYYYKSTAEKTKGKYIMRKIPKILRWRGYDPSSEAMDYKREQVTLFYAFRNEELDILLDNKFETIFKENVQRLCWAREDFCSGMNLDEVLAECNRLCDDEKCEDETRSKEDKRFVISVAEEKDVKKTTNQMTTILSQP